VAESPLLTACIVGCAAGIAALVSLIGRLRRLLRERLECRLPVVPTQAFEFQRPGEKCLHIEGPRFTTAFARVSFALRDQATGEAVPLRRAFFRATTGGVSRARLLTHRCTIKHAGRYELLTFGIREGADPAPLAIVFTGPYVGKMIALILGLVLAGQLVIGSLVLGILAATHQLS
jgi:hypothetical protein